MQDEDPQLVRARLGELLLDPAVAPSADLAVVEIRLGRVDGDDGHSRAAQHRVPVAEHILEVDVADIARVVVAGDHHHRVALELFDVRLGERVLVFEAERRQVARADDDVRLEVIDLDDRALDQVRDEVGPSAMDVGDMRNRERAVSFLRHGRSLDRR